MDKESWWAAVHGVAKEWDMTQRLSTHIICLLSSILGIEKGGKKLSRIQSVLLSAFLLFFNIYLLIYLFGGFPDSSVSKESACNAVQFLGWQDPLGKG